MRRVPVVVTGAATVADPFRRLVGRIAGDLAGREGYLLEIADSLGPEPSILVETSQSGGIGAESLVAAVLAGHAAATAHLSSLAGDPVDLAVMIADRRLGCSAALLPEVPFVALLARWLDAEVPSVVVTVDGAPKERLRDEAVVIARLLGIELRREHVEVEGDLADGELHWSAVIGDRFPRLVSRPVGSGAEATIDRRLVTVTSSVTGARDVTMSGPTAAPEAVAAALLEDVLRLAREPDTAWRAHRRKQAGAT